MDKVVGVVEWKGTQWNGAVTVNGQKYNFKKGVDHTIVNVGNKVELSLEQWTFKGKTGVSITDVKVLALDSTKVPEAPKTVAPTSAPVGRNFDKEARGKTVCQYVTAQLSNPSIDNSNLEAIFDRALKLMEMTFKV